MKKILALTVVALTFLVGGCGTSQKDYEKTMESYGKDYFEKYMTVQGLDEVEITISMLKNANQNANANYDLSKLEKCNDDSKVTFSLKKDTREIENTTFDLNCK